MLILTKNYAVKTGQPRFKKKNAKCAKQNAIESANLQNICRCINKYYICYFYQLLKTKKRMESEIFYKGRINDLEKKLKSFTI